MAIPKQHATPELENLRASAERLIAGGFAGASLLAPEDLALIGGYVQLYSFIELNLRRAVKLFVEADLLTATQGRKPVAANLVSLVKTAVAQLDLTDSARAEAVAKLDEIEFRYPFRNLLAHWAARRLPGHDAIILLTMDERDADQISPEMPAFDSLFHSIVKLADLHGLLSHLRPYEAWLAHQVTSWHKRHAPSSSRHSSTPP